LRTEVQIDDFDDYEIRSWISRVYNRLQKVKSKLKLDMQFCPNYWDFSPTIAPLDIKFQDFGTRASCYQFITDADFSHGAQVYYWFVLIMVTVSILSLLIDDTDCCRGPSQSEFPHDRWQIVEMSITVFFTVEYITLLSVVRNRLKYIVQFLPMLDFLAILPFYIDIILVEGLGEKHSWVKLIRLLRIARLARIRDPSNPYILMIGRTLRNMGGVMGGVVFYLGIGSLVCGTVANVLEPEVFYSVPIGAWYGLVTLTTVGYGDVYPLSEEGKIVGSFLIVGGLCLSSTVLMSVGSIYTNELDRLNDDYNEIKQCLYEQGKLRLLHGDDLVLAPQVEYEDLVETCIDSDYCMPEIGVICQAIKKKRKEANPEEDDFEVRDLRLDSVEDFSDHSHEEKV